MNLWNSPGEYPLCVNCQHYISVSTSNSDSGGRCAHQNGVTQHIVTGEFFYPWCNYMRDRWSLCGKKGKLFMRKEVTA